MEVHNDTYCVYVHINKINDKKYIGQTVRGDNPKLRWKNGTGYQEQRLFWRAIQKYGWNNFEHEVVASNLTKEEADNFEILLIKKLNTTNPLFGYNVACGGGGTLGRHPTEEQINKQKETMKKYYSDPDFIQKMRDVAQKRPIYQFTIDGIFVDLYESSMDAERKTGLDSGAISKCACGKAYCAGDYIFVFQEDIDNIMDRVEKYNNRRIQRKESIVRLTLDGNYIDTWKNAYTAERELGISYKNINSVCRHIRNKAGGFKWMYLSDYIQSYKTCVE
jgi:group I intron endonuclease